MSFFVKAAIDALKMVPQVNAEIRGTDIVYHNYYDIGIAVGGGKGLVVPAIRGLLGGPPLPEERFVEVRARTLVVVHPDDDVHPLASGRRLQESIPDCQLVVAPTMTHYREHPQELADIIEGFLQDSNAPPPPVHP
jgi:pimeloyl-ACP methyl ester carboxylesterase